MAKFDAGTPATRYAQARAEGLQKGFFGDNADAYVRDNYPEIFAGMGDNVPDLSIAKNPELLAPIEQAQAQTQAQAQAQAQTQAQTQEGPTTQPSPLTEEEINATYNKVFGRDVQSAGLDFHGGRRITVENLEAELRASPEFARLGGDAGGDVGGGVGGDVSTGIANIPAGQIIDLYQTELGRGPSEEEIKYYQNLYGDALDPFERRQFQSSPEAVRYRSTTQGGLPRLYEDVLNRLPTNKEMEFYKDSYGKFLEPQEVNRFIRAARFGDPTIGKEGEIITSLRDNLGIPTIRSADSADLEKGFYDTKPLDFSRFGAAPVTTGEGATAGIERLRPTDTTGTMIGAFESPQFTTTLNPYIPTDADILAALPFTRDPNVVSSSRAPVVKSSRVTPEQAESFSDFVYDSEAGLLPASTEEDMRGGGLASLGYRRGGVVDENGIPSLFIGGFIKKLVKPIFKLGKKILPAIVSMYNPAVGVSLAAADAGFKGGKFDLKDAALAGVKTLALSKLGEGIAGEAIGPASGGISDITEPVTNFGGFVEGVKAAGAKLGSGVMDRGGEILSGDFSGLQGLGKPAAVAGLAQTTEMGLDEAEKFKAEQGAVLAAQEEKKKKYRDLARRLGQQFPYGYNEGGVSSLPPRYLDGEGDGMSDSIRANIGGSQEARLADGEFVVPADVVADIGNGSSNAGAERLYSMMDRVRTARHGTTKQPPEVEVNRLLPA